MHNHDEKYPSRPGLESGTPRLQAPVDTNEPSGPATNLRRVNEQPFMLSRQQCQIIDVKMRKIAIN